MIDQAIQWIKRNTVPGEGIVVHTRKRVCYPEVTGYFINKIQIWVEQF